jgi:hypothetical protein
MANDVYKLSVKQVVASQYAENILCFQSEEASADNPLAVAQDLMASFQSTLEPGLLACLPSDAFITGYGCERINNTGGPAGYVTRTDASGGRPEASVLSGTGPLILTNYYDAGAPKPRWRTGRIFICGVSEGDCSENVFSAELLAAVTEWVATLVAPLGGGISTYQYGVWSRTEKHFYPIEAPGSIGLYPGSQRRRLRPTSR